MSLKQQYVSLTFLCFLLAANCACLAQIPQAAETEAVATKQTRAATPAALKTVLPDTPTVSVSPASSPRPLPTETAIEASRSMDHNETETHSARAEERINFAINHLAQRLGVEPSVVLVSVYEERVWRDGSLGCPQPGMMYTQALVPGYLVQLEIDGEIFSYHGADGRDPFLCESSAARPSSLTGP